MATIRCPECNATHPAPADPTVHSMRCPYCGASVTVPDLEARRRHQLELEREARLHAQHHAAAAREARQEAREARREAREARERDDDRKERRRGRWLGRIFSLFAILLAPTIIAITVFDLPARLGFGADGSDRLGQVATQLRSTGCTTVRAIASTYATGTVSQLVAAPAGCLRILAAGAGDHSSLGLRLYAPDGKLVEQTRGDTLDPQLEHCLTAPATYRYEITTGPAAKGRLSHAVLTCPAPAPAATPAKPAPAKKSR